jgi:hypothetical protein
MAKMNLNYSPVAPAISLVPPGTIAAAREPFGCSTRRLPPPTGDGAAWDAAAPAARLRRAPPARGRRPRHQEVLEHPGNHEGVFAFDLSRDGSE